MAVSDWCPETVQVRIYSAPSVGLALLPLTLTLIVETTGQHGIATRTHTAQKELPPTVRLKLALAVMDPLITVQVYRPESACLREEKENIFGGDCIDSSAPSLCHW